MHRHNHGSATPGSGREADLVFDFSDMGEPDLGGMVLVLTARQIADDDDRKVWVRSMSPRTWDLLHALGLENLFEDLPGAGEYVD